MGSSAVCGIDTTHPGLWAWPLDWTAVLVTLLPPLVFYILFSARQPVVFKKCNSYHFSPPVASPYMWMSWPLPTPHPCPLCVPWILAAPTLGPLHYCCSLCLGLSVPGWPISSYNSGFCSDVTFSEGRPFLIAHLPRASSHYNSLRCCSIYPKCCSFICLHVGVCFLVLE